MILQIISYVIYVLLLIIFIVGSLIPVETIKWWATYAADDDGILDNDLKQLRLKPDLDTNQQPAHFIIWLSGVADLSGDILGPMEVQFLEKLKANLANTRIISDIYPYSVTNTSLDNKGLLARFWRGVDKKRKEGHFGPGMLLVNLHNVLKVATSADDRYGPLFNLGTAREMLFGLLRHDYRLGSGTPITLMGSSGGVQIGLGAAGYLAELVKAPITLISLAGVFGSVPGALAVEHIHIIEGTKDPIAPMGSILFPSRSPFAFNSDYNKARSEGKITTYVVGPMRHNENKGYLDPSAHLPNGLSYQDKTVETILGIIVGAGLDTRVDIKLQYNRI